MKRESGEKIFAMLYVEVERISRELAANKLSRHYPGTRIDMADNGVTGLDLFMKYHYNLIITDYRMPGMSGLRMVSEIRAVRPGTPVIFLTARLAQDDLQNIPFEGLTFFIRKPLRFSELFTLINRIRENEDW